MASTFDFDFDRLSIWYYVFILLITVFLRMAIYLYLYFHLNKYETQWSSSKVKVLKKNSREWNEINIDDLQVGDILMLACDTICPGDLLVLDTDYKRHNQGVMKSSDKAIDGQNKIKTKKTFRNLGIKIGKLHDNEEEYIVSLMKTMNGYIEYQPPSGGRHESFSGNFKLKDDPKVTKINSSNVVLCGTKVITRR